MNPTVTADARSTAMIDSVQATAYTIPTDAAESDGTASWHSTTMVIAAVTCDGITGTGWTYGPAACAQLITAQLAPVVEGRDPMSVPGTWLEMVHTVRNDTRAGVAGYAISALDVACWDLKARLLHRSLVDLFGRVHTEVPVYGSGGFTSYEEHQLTEQLTRWAHDQQIPRVKIKIGQDGGRDVARDLDRIAQARAIIGPDTDLYVDANGAYSAKQAIRVMRACADERVSWFEEPVSSNDLTGLRVVRDLVDADVTAGEYGTDVGYFQRMCAAGAVDCLQIDATRCGGYTEWLRCAAVAAGHELTVSGHCAPNLHAHVAAATPNLRHLEWFHDHVRIEELAFTGVLDPRGGTITPDPTSPGHGLTLRAEELDSYRVRGRW